MAIQIVDNGASIDIVTNSIPLSVNKSSIITVRVVSGTTVKLDIGKGSLYNIYINQAQVTVPTTSSAEDLRTKIMGMLQTASGSGGGGGDASSANQQLQTAELQNIKNGVLSTNGALLDLNTAIIDLCSKVDLINDKLFYEPIAVDETSGNIVYKGYAVWGTSSREAKWAIQKVVNDDGMITYSWAGGNRLLNKVWDDRKTLTYS
jgi:hypothetical protein